MCVISVTVASLDSSLFVSYGNKV